MRKLLILYFFSSFSLSHAQDNDTIDFDTQYPVSENSVITIDSMTGLWQVGTPSKNTFVSSLSSPRALVTDTLNDYPTNTNSYIYFHVDYGASMALTGEDLLASLSFDSWLETDTLLDYGKMELYLNGQWVEVGQGAWYGGWAFDFTPPYPAFLNDSAIFSGISLGWVHYELEVRCSSVFQPEDYQRGMSPYFQFRILYRSDSISESNDGWMIDNMVWKHFIGECVGSVGEEVNSIQISISPTLSNGNISFETESELFSKITIYDFSGKMIDNFSFSPSNFKTLELSNLSNGMYFYSVEDGKAVGKFMIEK